MNGWTGEGEDERSRVGSPLRLGVEIDRDSFENEKRSDLRSISWKS